MRVFWDFFEIKNIFDKNFIKGGVIINGTVAYDSIWPYLSPNFPNAKRPKIVFEVWENAKKSTFL